MLAPLAFFESPAAHWLSLALLHFWWQGAAIAGLAALLMRVLKSARPTLRYAVGLIGLASMAACPVATLGWHFFRRASDEARWMTTTELLVAVEMERLPTMGSFLLRIEPYFLGFWLSGVAIFAGRLLLGTAGTVRLKRHLSPVPASVFMLAVPLASRLRMEAKNLVFVSRDVSEALAVGLFRPLVLLPASWISEMPPAVLEAVLAHELAHVARHDLWVNWLQRVIETLLFYHPAVWWLSGRVRVERELCADELAIQLTGKRMEYVEALAHIAAERQADMRPLLAALLKGEPSMRLLQRVRRLLGQPTSESSRLWPAGVMALTIPLALWALTAVSGQDERDEAAKPKLKRERVQIELRDEDAPRLVRDREREEAKDGDKRETLETRVERYVIARDGEKPREIERRTVTKDGKPVTVVEVGMDKKLGIISDSSDRRIDELTALVKRLSADVERLQDEIARLRSDKTRLQDGAHEMPLKRKPGVAAREREEERKALELKLRDDDLYRAVKEKMEAGIKERAAEQKEQARRVQAEVERKLENAREEVEQAVRRKVEAARRAEGARKLDAERQSAGEEKKQAEALREKAEAARGKIDAEIKELEKKLKKLKEGEVSALNPEVALELEFVPKLNAVLVEQPKLQP